MLQSTSIPARVLIAGLGLCCSMAQAQTDPTTSSPSISSSMASASTSTSTAETSTQTATIAQGSDGYKYLGCYNETTTVNGTAGLRALNGGVQEADDTMTVQMCLAFCQSNDMEFAGLEYTRECYCSPYLSSLSAMVPATECNLACEGNTSEICGGSLRVSVYQGTTSGDAKGIATVGRGELKGKAVLALGVAIAGVLFMC